MYCRNADFGKICFKCTENELKTCPRVRFSAISPESRVLSARAYIIVKFRHRIPVLYAAHSVGRCVRSACHPAFRPVAAIFLVGKQKSWLLCNFFAIRDSFLSPKSGNGSFLRLISCAFVLRSAIGGHATIPNRKKVAIWAAILFLGFRSGFGQRGSGARGIDCRTGKKAAPWGGPDGHHGIFRAALGDRFGRPVDRRGSVLRAPPPHAFLAVARCQLIVVIRGSIPYFCGEGYLAGRIGVP